MICVSVCVCVFFTERVVQCPGIRKPFRYSKNPFFFYNLYLSFCKKQQENAYFFIRYVADTIACTVGRSEIERHQRIGKK